MKDLEQLIRKDEALMGFVNGEMGKIVYNVLGVPICIFKENVGVSYYYQRQEDCGNIEVDTFMMQAKPIISNLLEEAREKKLYGSDCIR